MRYINLCRTDPKAPLEPKPPIVEQPTKYEIYKQTYENYNNTEGRKEFMKDYNKKYRLSHSNTIECECGVSYKDISKYAHIRSKRHLKFENKSNNNT